MFRQLAVTALLSLYGMAYADNVDSVNSILTCPANYYADGAIYRSESGSDLEGFPAKTSFLLNLATVSHTGTPIDPILPAQKINTHEYKAISELLYINASTGAYAPVGFVAGDNSTLGAGETTWGFFSPYGFLLWYDLSKDNSGPVHAQGFQWVPVDGYTGLTKLYWNQTQYDLAANGSTSVSAAKAAFGLCGSDPDAAVSWA